MWAEAFNSSIPDEEAGGSLKIRGQPGPHNEFQPAKATE